MSGATMSFPTQAKVVISPDEMRAWIMLPEPGSGTKYTTEMVGEWLEEKGVVYGVDPALVRTALASKKYDELLEVARGEQPVPASGGGHTLHVEKKPFTGLTGAGDGSLFYDNLSFLQEVKEGAVLAELFPPDAGQPGRTVTGQPVEPKAVEPVPVLEGVGFAVTDDGRYYRAPSLSHISFVGDQLIVTPLKKLKGVTAEDGAVQFEGNILVEGDVLAGSVISATGSIFITGRTDTATLISGRHVLASGGMRCGQGIGTVEAKENVWGLMFESVNITAGGDISANHLSGCEVQVQGRANILGGSGAVTNTELYAKNGVVAQKLGDQTRSATLITAGMDADLIDRSEAMEKRLHKINLDITTLQQNITAFERVNRTKPDKGKKDPKYLEMTGKKTQLMSVLGILSKERTRVKRQMEQFSAVNIIARDSAWPGLTVVIDTRSFSIEHPLQRCKFKRNGDVIEVTALQNR